MEENKNVEKLGIFTSKYVKEIESENISSDFTSSVMDKILLEKSSKVVFKIDPLITKKAWLIIGSILVGVIFLSLNFSDGYSTTLPNLDLMFLNKMKLSKLTSFNTLSSIAITSLCLFSLMFTIQVILLKNHFNKRFF